MVNPYFDEDPWDEESAFELGRTLYNFCYGFFAGHFVRPTTKAQRLARLTAIPSIVLGPMAILLLILSGPSFAMQGAICIGSLVWFCYTAWAIYTVEQTYVKDLEEAQRGQW